MLSQFPQWLLLYHFLLIGLAVVKLNNFAHFNFQIMFGMKLLLFYYLFLGLLFGVTWWWWRQFFRLFVIILLPNVVVTATTAATFLFDWILYWLILFQFTLIRFDLQRRFWLTFFLNCRYGIVGADNLWREVWWANALFTIYYILECISYLILLGKRSWMYFRCARVIDHRIPVFLLMCRTIVVLILVLGCRIIHKGVPFVVCWVIHCIFNSDCTQYFIGFPHASIDS